MRANELPSKQKENYASLIHPGSGQCHLDWRRLGRPPAGHHHCDPVAPLTAGYTAEDFTKPRDSTQPMKNYSLIITILFAGCGLATAQEPSKGRIYLGAVRDAPAWVWEAPKASSETNQAAANSAWVKWGAAAFSQHRAEAQKAGLNVEAGRAEPMGGSKNKRLKPEAGGAQFARERGVILDYNPGTFVGVISGEDGKRWPFRAAEWTDLKDDPKRGLWVDFVPENETGYALFLYSLGPLNARHLQLESAR